MAAAQANPVASISDEQLEACSQVLQQLLDTPNDAFWNKRFKALRDKTQQVANRIESRFFQGSSLKDYVLNRVKKLEAQFRQSRDLRLKELDRKHINSRQLRADRINALQALTEQRASNLLTGSPTAVPLLMAPGDETASGSVVGIHALQQAESDAKAAFKRLGKGKEQQGLLTEGGDDMADDQVDGDADEPEVDFGAGSTFDAGIDGKGSKRKAAKKAANAAKARKVTSSPSPVPPAAQPVAAVASDTGNGSSSSSAAPLSSPSGSIKQPASFTAGAPLAASTSAAASVSPVAASGPRSATGDVTVTDDVDDEVVAERAKQQAAAILSDASSHLEGHLKTEADEFKAESLLFFPRSCYICKARYHKMHHFYDQLCPTCADLNWKKRQQTADLRGKYALLTGSRVKIGFFCGLRLLRCGATLIATSRFPHDTARRYAAEADFDTWKDRLHVYGLDLRDLPSVNRFCLSLASRYPRIDIIINNAAQTVHRPPAYYRHLMPIELTPLAKLPEQLRGLVRGDGHTLSGAAQQAISDSKASASASVPDSAASAESAAEPVVLPGLSVSSAVSPHAANTVENRAAAMSQLPLVEGDDLHDHLFPQGAFDITGQQLDLRKTNSWLLLLDQVDPSELVAVFAVNALAPFIINSRLRQLMSHNDGCDRFIINVSAMEGKFYRHKGPEHPHTNMAKAALNMMTRTSAQDYVRNRIYMNSVDTGWINDENPFEREQAISADNNFQTPIDEIDAMARILDLVLDGVNKGPGVKHPFGQFFKDYHVSEW